MKGDSMKFKVLKEFINPSDGKLYSPNEIIDFDLNSDTGYVQDLIKYSFIEEFNDEKWKPKEGDEYWFVWDDGFTVNIEWCESNGEDARIAIGNCFQTKEQADKAVEWLKAFKVLRDDVKTKSIDWDDGKAGKWTVVYDYAEKILDTTVYYYSQTNVITFANEQEAIASIQNHNKEWLTFYGVEE